MGCEQNTSSGEVQPTVKQAERLFEEHGEFIHSIARFSLSDQSAVEDFCHELFMYFVTKPMDLENAHIRGLLYRIIKCRAKNWSRRVTSYKQRIQRYTQIKRENGVEKTIQTIADLYDIQKIYQAIEDYLPEKEAQAVLLRYRDQHDLRQTAQIMGVKSETVKRYVSVGLKKLRNHLKNKKEVKP